MTILSPAGLTANSPFCDALDLTFPREQGAEVVDALRPFLVAASAVCEGDGTWRVPRYCLTLAEAQRVAYERVPVVKLDAFGQVQRVSFSGGAVQSFARQDMWRQMLAEMFPFPHRVTRLDASIDFDDIPGPDALAAVVSAGRAGGLHLGRKTVDPKHVQEQRSLDARGALTGTVYLGKPGREIRLKVYDKRHELESRGCDDPGVWTRCELTVRKVGATMRDACEPGALFWNYAGDVVAPPADAPSWHAGETGFALPPRAEVDYWALLRRRVDDWVDLRELGLLADKLGVYGRSALLGLLATALGLEAPGRVRRATASAG